MMEMAETMLTARAWSPLGPYLTAAQIRNRKMAYGNSKAVPKTRQVTPARQIESTSISATDPNAGRDGPDAHLGLAVHVTRRCDHDSHRIS